jgi:hypothetical protein
MTDPRLRSVTYRIPEALADAVERSATDRGINISQLVREALEAAVSPNRYRFELPGFSQKFDDFLKEVAPSKKHIYLLVESLRGERWFLDGSIVGHSGSVVQLACPDLRRIARADIHGWEIIDNPASLPTIAMTCAQDGWRPAKNYFPR